MIPFFRSLTELMLITQSRDKSNQIHQSEDLETLTEDRAQRKRYIRYKDKESIDLPYLPIKRRRKWTKSKEAISKFFDELDYNNQIQSSYDITLLNREINSHNQDVA